MSNAVPDSKTPALVAVAIAVVGLVIGLVVSGWVGKLVAGLIAAGGAIPAAVGMWKGIQQQTQGTLAVSLGALLFALGVGAALVIWAVVVAVS